jgi:hypothetical protein
MLNLPDVQNHEQYFNTILSTSGVLLGLAFTALIFVLQSGFSSFQFSRRMFLEYYTQFGKKLLYSLAYLTIISLSATFFQQEIWILNFIFYIFVIMFTKVLLDQFNRLGYIHTLHSHKFVPKHFGSFRRYFRFISNLGWWANIQILVEWATIILLPLLITLNDTGYCILTIKALVYSTFTVLISIVIATVRFLNQFFLFSTIEFESRRNENNDKSSTEQVEVDYSTERRALKKFLTINGHNELDIENSLPILGGTLYVNLDEKRSGEEAWFNISVDNISESDVSKIKDELFRYTHKLLSLLQRSLVDINIFVLSFHVRIIGDKKSVRNLFFRIQRSELNAIFAKLDEPVATIAKIKNQLHDELFR